MSIRINGEPVQILQSLDGTDQEIVIEIDNEEDSAVAVEIRMRDRSETDPAGNYRFRVSGDSLTVQRSSGAGWSGGTSLLELDDTGIGFFAATPVAQQTGVAVSAAAIHAALVAFGLITA